MDVFSAALPELDLVALQIEAKTFALRLSAEPIPELFGITDGKAVGTYVEVQFNAYLKARYTYTAGNAATGVDFPTLGVDLKATSIRQPQSSCPFRNAAQKIYGLGYDLLVFVYDKADDVALRNARLNMRHVIFVPRARTADYQTTFGLRTILANNGNRDDIDAFLEDRNLPLDPESRVILAERILREPPHLGCLTISNALQWRLQYGRAITFASTLNADAPDIADLLGER